jgi:hypothetical protein
MSCLIAYDTSSLTHGTNSVYIVEESIKYLVQLV